MIKKRLQKISQILDDSFFNNMLEIARRTGVKPAKPPETGLLMSTLKDTFDTEFYLGEVLITEAMAVLDGQQGYAMVIGDCQIKAEVLASTEVIEKSADKYKAVIGEMEKELESLETAVNKIAGTENAFVASTRVNFETMRKG